MVNLFLGDRHLPIPAWLWLPHMWRRSSRATPHTLHQQQPGTIGRPGMVVVVIFSWQTVFELAVFLRHSRTSLSKASRSRRKGGEAGNWVKTTLKCQEFKCQVNYNLYDIISATLRTHNTRAVVPFLFLIHPTLDTNLQKIYNVHALLERVTPGGPT